MAQLQLKVPLGRRYDKKLWKILIAGISPLNDQGEYLNFSAWFMKKMHYLNRTR